MRPGFSVGFVEVVRQVLRIMMPGRKLKIDTIQNSLAEVVFLGVVDVVLQKNRSDGFVSPLELLLQLRHHQRREGCLID